MNPKEMAFSAAQVLYENHGQDVRVFDVSNQSDVAEYMVIATGRNPKQINLLSMAIEQRMKHTEKLDHREGHRSGTWVLLDYNSVVIHIFSDEARNFYALDQLWAKGQNVPLPDFDSE